MIKILVLDRDPDVLLAVQDMLNVMGHHVKSVTSSADALTALSREKFDILFTNRTDTVTKLDESLLMMFKAMQPQLPIVLTSSWYDSGGTSALYDGLLQKPFSMADLGAMVAKLCPES